MRAILLPALAVCLLGCGPAPAPAPQSAAAPTPVPSVPAVAETEATREDGANDPRLWLHPREPERSLILAATGTGGLEVYGLDGKRRQVIEQVSSAFVDVRYDFDLGGKLTTLVLVHDAVSATLMPFTVDAASLALQPLPGRPVPVATQVTGLCSFRSPITGKAYAFAVTDEGTLQQWALLSRDGKFDSALVRTVPLGKGAGYCAVDDAADALYFTDETLGVFRLPADPEAETERQAVDLVKPFGNLESEPKGLAIVRDASGGGQLVVADSGSEQYHLYDLEGKHLGRVSVAASAAADAVGETEGISYAPLTTPSYPQGVVLVTDQDNEGGLSNFKLVSWQAVRQAIGLTGKPKPDGRVAPAAVAHTVRPRLETAPAQSYGDAADDPAIWVNPQDAARSAVIATDKKLGLYVYDLAGRLLQTVPDGRMNNVDLRADFPFGDGKATVVASDNRIDKSLMLYRFDGAKRMLERRMAAPILTGLADPYGLCMYRSARNGAFYVFINDGEDGRYKQWRLQADGRNVTAEVVREFTVGSIAEGCVADDETGTLYIAEENVGLWRYSAEPDGGDTRRQVDRIGGPNPLVDDLEGVSIYTQAGGRGYLVVSNQGANNYLLYRREGDNAFVGTFHIVADAERGIDGAAETDGLDVVSAPLGAQFPQGLLVVQDGRNLTPAEKQNYKFVSWADLAAGMKLEQPAR